MAQPNPLSDPLDGIDEDVALLGDLAVDEQLPVYERMHAVLTAALAASDTDRLPRPGSGG